MVSSNIKICFISVVPWQYLFIHILGVRGPLVTAMLTCLRTICHPLFLTALCSFSCLLTLHSLLLFMFNEITHIIIKLYYYFLYLRSYSWIIKKNVYSLDLDYFHFRLHIAKFYVSYILSLKIYEHFANYVTKNLYKDILANLETKLA